MRYLIKGVTCIAACLTVTLGCSKERSDPLSPNVGGDPSNTSSYLQIGPVEGLTTAWHAAPQEFGIPKDTLLRLRCAARASAVVTWEGAMEVSRDNRWSIAECATDRFGNYPVKVRIETNPGSADAITLEAMCAFSVVDASAQHVSVRNVVLERLPLHLRDDMTNWETMKAYSAGSIAALRHRGPTNYRTAVGTPVKMTCDLTPASLGALVEWRLDGRAIALGQNVQLALPDAIGSHMLSAGPTGRAQVTLELYRVHIVEDESLLDRAMAATSLTFHASTQPPGYESEVSWLASTRFGTVSPILGDGATFSVRFDDIVGHESDGTSAKWIGIRADNTVLASDLLPGIEIIYPSENQVIQNGIPVIAKIPVQFPFDNVASVEFYVSDDGVNYVPIVGQEEFDGTYSTLWNTKSLQAGLYFIRATMTTTTAQTVHDVVVVAVNEQPTSVATASVPADYVVDFDGSTSFDDDGSIVGYLWEFSDGTSATGVAVQHTFAPGDTNYLSLTVTDNQGGKDVSHHILTFPFPATISFHKKQYCGCKKMRVKGAGAVEGPVGFAPELVSGIAAPHQGTLGFYNINGNVKYRFEVIADLVEPSDPRKCFEGQRAKGTWSAGGKTWHAKGKLSRGSAPGSPAYDSSRGPDNPYDPTDDPAVTEEGEAPYNSEDPLQWVDDTYHGGSNTAGSGENNAGLPPGLFKAYKGQEQIMWVDAAGLKPEAVGFPKSFMAKFHATVGGFLGVCECAWMVFINVDANGNVVQSDLVVSPCTP